MQREVFGPVVSITVFDDESAGSGGPDLLTMVWHPPSGLRTSGGRTGSARLQYGVRINTISCWLAKCRMEGKTVGIRQDMSLYGLEDYTLVRHIMVKRKDIYCSEKS